MKHALMRQTVKQLEEIFAGSKADETVLKQLEDELRYRGLPHALALLVEVQGVLYGAKASAGTTAGSAPKPAPAQQPDAWVGPQDALPRAAPSAVPVQPVPAALALAPIAVRPVASTVQR